MLALLITLSASLVPQGPGPSTAPVVINEFVYDDSSTDDKEFVELFNRTNAPVDISGWRIIADDPTTTNPSYTIPAGTVLLPGAYYVMGSGTVPNVNQVLGTTNLFENDNESLELVDAANNVIDSIAYEIGRGTWGPHPREGTGIWAEIVTVDANPHSHQRRVDGYDSDDNGCDFCIMHWTPGAANGSGQTLAPGLRNNFDAAPGTSLIGDFNHAFVAPSVQDPASITNATGSTISLPASPQGGNVAVMHDITGGGNASYLKIGASSQFLLETYVYVRGGNPVFAAPSPTTGEGEAWAIGVTGMTDGPAHPINVNNYWGDTQCTGLRPGATGVAWWCFVRQAQAEIYLVSLGSGGPGFTVLAGPIVATAGSNDGWQRLRLRIDGGDLVANFGGTYGCDDGQRFTASGVGNCGGNVYFQYRECIVTNANMTPLVIDRLEVYGITGHAVTFGGTASPTSFGTPTIGTAGGNPVIGNTGFQVTGTGLVPFGVSGLVLGVGSLTPGFPIPGAPATALLYVSPILNTVLVFSDAGGNGAYNLAIPCLNNLVGLPVTAQFADFDPTLPFATPIGTSQGMHVLVGN